jgi:competence protein ComEC
MFEDFIIGAVIAASFCAILFFTLNKKFFIINILFFIMGIVSFSLYFNLKVPSLAEIRVIENKSYYCIGDYKGRKVILNGGKTKDFKEGDNLEVIGIFSNNSDLYKGIIGSYKIESYNILKKDFIWYLYDIKRNVYAKYKQKLGEEKAALIMSLCYGDTEYLSKSQKSQFQKLGVLHAVSVSGFHMAIIYKVLENILGLKISIFISFIYILFTGIQGSTLRAFIMIFIFKFSKVVFKNYDSISSLSLAAIIILLHKPYYISDIGFTLSFLATLGILLYYKRMLKSLYRLPQKVNESLSITLSSQIFSLPYICFTLQKFSAGFIVGNFFLLPIYSVIVVLGNIALLTYKFSFIFNILTSGLKFILTSLDGANYLILKVCPDVSYLNYLDGVAFLLILFSLIMYNQGYQGYKYLPILIVLLMLFRNYSFVPQIYYTQFTQGEGVVLKYKNHSIMICNYDEKSAKEVIKLKEEMNVDKVISNYNTGSVVEVGKNLYLKAIQENGLDMSIVLNYNDRTFLFTNGSTIPVSSNNNIKYYIIKFPENRLGDNTVKKFQSNLNEEFILYVIIFNKVLEI